MITAQNILKHSIIWLSQPMQKTKLFFLGSAHARARAPNYPKISLLWCARADPMKKQFISFLEDHYCILMHGIWNIDITIFWLSKKDINEQEAEQLKENSDASWFHQGWSAPFMSQMTWPSCRILGTGEGKKIGAFLNCGFPKPP